MTDIPPPLIPDNGDKTDAFADTAYTAGELEKMEYDTLRSIAAKHPSEAVNGRMGKQDLRDGLEGLERVDA